jgi:uncharacterized membrane protein YfcA
VSGFGIGSLLTPLLAWKFGIKMAVAMVVIPHFFATAWRFWLLRAHLDRRVVLTFGLTSALGGLAGAWLHTLIQSRALALVFGTLLIVSALGQWLGFWNRFRFGRVAGTAAGLLSGLLGGLVGNQGGIRTAAMFGFHVPKEAFVATGTAAALVVDIVRAPVYVWSQQLNLAAMSAELVSATAGTLLGTWLGLRWLRRMPENVFRHLVAALLALLGLFMILSAA